jgi:hypothetical protein
MEARRAQETDEQALESLRRAWCLGSEAFRQQLLRQMEGQLGDHHSGEMKRESAEPRPSALLLTNWNVWDGRQTSCANEQEAILTN